MLRNNRRMFLKSGFKLATLLAFHNPTGFLFSTGKTMPTWTELIDYARWCPNVHNLQPHRIKIISEIEAELYYDPTRLLPQGDPNSIFVTIAMGIFIEHLSIAAAPYATKVEVVKVFEPITINAKRNTLFAKLKLSPTLQEEPIDRRLIFNRKTSRLNYDGRPLKPELLNKIKTESAIFGFDFFSSSNPKVVDFIIELNQETLFEDLQSTLNRKELDHLFRYSQKEAFAKRDGLWSKCMCFPGLLMKAVFRHPKSWLTGNKEHILASYYKHSFRGTATICGFSGKFRHTNDWLRAGRMLARTWLLVTADHAFIQPFGSLITNPNAFQKINTKFRNSVDDNEVWMVFRAGYSEEPTRSYRLTTDEIILK